MAIDFQTMIWQAVRGKPLGRPVSLNDERANHWGDRRSKTGKWRRASAQVFSGAVAGGEIRRMYVANVQVVPYYKRGPMPDVGAVAPTVKAVIDGMVDAGIVPDDNPPHLSRIVFERPRKGTADGLGIRVREGTPLVGHDYASCKCEEIRQRQAEAVKIRAANKKRNAKTRD